MKTRKKICYLFVFDGFADHEVLPLVARVCNPNLYQLKTIAISKDPVRAMSGMTILPDLDFKPEVDLYDIDDDNTAMLILPGGSPDKISALVDHCIANDIPIYSELYEESYS